MLFLINVSSNSQMHMVFMRSDIKDYSKALVTKRGLTILAVIFEVIFTLTNTNKI